MIPCLHEPFYNHSRSLATGQSIGLHLFAGSNRVTFFAIPRVQSGFLCFRLLYTIAWARIMFRITLRVSRMLLLPGGNCPRVYPIAEKTVGALMVHHTETRSERAAKALQQ